MSLGLDLGNLLVHLRLDESQYIRSIKNVEQKMKVTADKLTSIGTRMSVAVTLPLVLFARNSIKAFSEFDLKMTESLAIMGGVSSGMRDDMEQVARSLSLRGVKSSAKLAESYFFLASAGLDVKQSIAALPQVMQFATAGAFSMAEATDLATDAQSALGLTVEDSIQNLENLTRVTDVLVGANTLANASTRQFSLALTSDAGSAMRAMGIQLEEGVAVLAAYADQGKKAQEAGNLFGRMLRLMTKGFQNNREAWRSFNLEVFDAAGNYRPLADIIEDLSNKMKELSPEARGTALEMLGFEARSVKAIQPLLGMSDAIRGYLVSLKGMKGITNDVAEKQLKAFSNQMLIAKNHVIAMREEIGKQFRPILLKLAEVVKVVSLWFIQLDDSTKSLVVQIAAVVATIGPLTLSIGLLMKAFFFIKGILVALVPVVGVIAALGAAVFTVATAWRNNFGNMRTNLIEFGQAVREILVNITENFKSAYNFIQVNFIKILPQMLLNLQTWAGQAVATIEGVFAAAKFGERGTFAEVFNDAFDDSMAAISNIQATFNAELIESFEGVKGKVTEISKFTGQAFSELWQLNIAQAKADLESFSSWLDGLSNKLASNDPLLQTVQNLKNQADILNRTVKEAMEITVAEEDEIAKVTKGFTAESLRRFQEFQTSVTSITEQGLMSIARNWESWGETVKNILKEVYFEALRVALIAPAAKSLAGSFTGGAKALFSGLNIGTQDPVPATAQGATGGSVERTGFALIHKGETLSGVNNEFSGGGNITLKLHYEGQPLVVSKQQSYLQSDQRIKEVWLKLADNDMSVRSKMRQVSQSR